MANPPVFKLPPPKPKGSKAQVFQAFVSKWGKQYPGLKQNAYQIAAAAEQARIDPVYFASMLIAESGARMVKGGTGGRMVGFGQLNPDTFLNRTFPWDPNHRVTLADLQNPATNLKLSAFYIREGLDQGYNYANVYSSFYNPADPNRFLAQDKILGRVPSSYLPGVSTSGAHPQVGPQQQAQQAVTVRLYEKNLTDPYVAVRNGKLTYVQPDAAGNLPQGVVRVGGLPVNRSTFASSWRDLNEIYTGYLGRQANPTDVATYLANPISTTFLRRTLASQPAFLKSPVFKSIYPAYEKAWQDIYGLGSKPDIKAVQHAMALGMQPTEFQTTLRNRPDYLRSDEFQKGYSTLAASYQKIYGTPGQAGQNLIKHAVAGGWSTDQFETWLRGQPAYTTSPEYNTKMLYVADKLGMITGTMPDLVPGKGGKNPNPPGGKMPASPLLPGQIPAVPPNTIGGQTYSVNSVTA